MWNNRQDTPYQVPQTPAYFIQPTMNSSGLEDPVTGPYTQELFSTTPFQVQGNYIPSIHPSWMVPMYYPPSSYFPTQEKTTEYTFVQETGKPEINYCLSNTRDLLSRPVKFEPVDEQMKTEATDTPSLRRKYVQHPNCGENCKQKRCQELRKRNLHSVSNTGLTNLTDLTDSVLPLTSAIPQPSTLQAPQGEMQSTPSYQPFPVPMFSFYPPTATTRSIPVRSSAVPYSAAPYFAAPYSSIPNANSKRENNSPIPTAGIASPVDTSNPPAMPSVVPCHSQARASPETFVIPLNKQPDPIFTKRQNARVLTTTIQEAAEHFVSTPFFMGKFQSHGQEVHLAAIPVVEIHPNDRRWPNPRKEGNRLSKGQLSRDFAKQSRSNNAKSCQVFKLDPIFVVTNPKFGTKRISLWRERLYCCGIYGCSANTNAENKKHSKCTVEVTCTIWADAPAMMEIRVEGDHGPAHKPPAQNPEEVKRRITLEMDNFIKQQLVVNPSITPTELHLALTTTLKDKFSKSGAAPTMRKLINKIAYLRKRGHINATDCKILHELLDDPEVQQFVLYPKKKEDYPSKDTKDWYIVFADEGMLEDLDKFGREIVGLDGNYKFTKYRIPFWVIVAEDDHHNATPGAFILASSDKAKLLAEGLKIVAQHVPNSNWDPSFTIDKDDKELSAIKTAGIFTQEVFLCQWHVMKTWKKHLIGKIKNLILRGEVLSKIYHIQRSTSYLQVLGRSIKLRMFCAKYPELHEFMAYFEENWLCRRWRMAWLDLPRKNRWGLYNTNNFSETTFRKMGRLFFRNRARLSISSLVLALTKLVMNYYNVFRTQKRSGLIPIKPSQQERTEERQKENASEIVNEGLIEHCACACKNPDMCECGRHEDLFKCHSQRGPHYYWVNLYCKTCTCAYFGTTGRSCKHIFAAILFKQSTQPDVTGEEMIYEVPSPEPTSESTDADIDVDTEDPPPSVPKDSGETCAGLPQSKITELADKLIEGQRDPLSMLATLQDFLQGVLPLAKPNEKPNPKPKPKTPFSPENVGRPVHAKDTFRFKTHKKRGPKKKHTLDGVDRQNPPNYDNIQAIVGKKGIKYVYLAAQWSDGSTTWEPADKMLVIPRIEQLYTTYLEKKEEATKQKRKEARQQKTTAKTTSKGTTPAATTSTATTTTLTSTATTPSMATTTSTATTTASTTASTAASTTDPNCSELVPEIEHTPIASATSSTSTTADPTNVVSSTQQSKTTTPPRKSQRKRKIMSPIQDTPPAPALVVSTDSNNETTTPVRLAKKRAKKRANKTTDNSSNPNTTPEVLRSPPGARKSLKPLSTPERRVLIDFPAAKHITRDHPLCAPPYCLSPYMIEQMDRAPHIQLVPVTELIPCVEYDRRVDGKYAEDTHAARNAMKRSLLHHGVSDEILLHYSLRDRKVYVIEGNLRIATARTMKDIKYLPARVIALRAETPRKVGVVASTHLDKNTKGTHFSPSSIGFTVAQVSL